jgi:hypothetical protein
MYELDEVIRQRESEQEDAMFVLKWTGIFCLIICGIIYIIVKLS